MMLSLSLLAAVAGLTDIAFTFAFAAASPPSQKPLVDGGDHVFLDHQGDEAASQSYPPPRWSLNFTSPTPHLFASVSSLLHQWSNTIFPNGHALAAVEIPAYTLLYHGLISPEDPLPSPPSPEWLAFDLEMSYGIMGSDRNSFLLTYQTTRPVKALYFDGESAALMGLGQLDTQMLQLFANVSGPPGRGFMDLGQEYLRAHGLCDWFEEAGLGRPGWGFEGIVRMNAGFEVIWCDFTSSSLRLVSRMNVTAPLLPVEDDEGEAGDSYPTTAAEEAEEAEEAESEAAAAAAAAAAPTSTVVEEGGGELARAAHTSGNQQPKTYYPLPPQPTRTDRDSEPSHPAAPPNMRRDQGREPFLKIQGWAWFDSATWHYGSTRNGPGQGEARAKALSCGILSYYSPRFVNQSLNRALDERKSLNLTGEGLWTGPGEDGNRTRAIKQLARRRRFHHLGDVVPKEALLMRNSSERALRSLLEGDSECSGADWVLITSEIVQRVTNHLTTMDTRLASAPSDLKNETAVYSWLFDLRAQSHLFMVGYLEYPDKVDRNTWSTQSDLYHETYSRCRYRYTRLLVPEERRASLSPEEEDIRLAVEDVYGTICSVLITMGFGVERAWADLPTGKRRVTSSGATALATQASVWRDNIVELTAWLGWESEYYGCKEICAWDERCYIPMWPLMHRGGRGGGPGRGRGRGRGPGRGGPGNGTHPGGPGMGRGPPGGEHHPPEIDDDDELPPPPPQPLPPPPPPGHGGKGPGKPPGFKMPPRGPWWMGEDTELWEPKCVNINYIMGQ